MKPALSREEWERIEDGSNLVEYLESSHAIAAVHLHNQPFGFTREMVDKLRQAADDPEAHYYADLEINDIVADIIEALLPPEDV